MNGLAQDVGAQEARSEEACHHVALDAQRACGVLFAFFFLVAVLAIRELVTVAGGSRKIGLRRVGRVFET